MSATHLTWVDLAVLRRDTARRRARKEQRQRGLGWVFGALFFGAAAVIVAAVLTRAPASWTPTVPHEAHIHVAESTAAEPCVQKMYVDDSGQLDENC